MFRVLEVDSPEWTACLAALPADRRDVHFGPRLLAVYQATFGWKVGLAVTNRSPNDFIIEPIVLTNEGQRRHAYNFGGPLISSDLAPVLEHRLGMAGYDRDHGVTSVYATLNPFLHEHQPTLQQHKVKDTVWMNLHKPNIRGTTKRLANKAQGAGVQVFQVGLSAIPTFYEMYNKTMDRAGAKSHWYFPLNYFENLYKLCKPAMLFALVDGKPEAGCIILSGYGGPAYYHFAGSYGNFPSLGVNHALVMAAAEYAHKVLKCSKLHLGGGVTPAENDGLYVFKRGFSDNLAPVFTYQRERQQQAA